MNNRQNKWRVDGALQLIKVKPKSGRNKLSLTKMENRDINVQKGRQLKRVHMVWKEQKSYPRGLMPKCTKTWD